MKKKSFLILVLLVLPFMEPLSFKEISILDNIYSILKVINLFIIFVIYIFNLKRNKYKISKFMFIVVLYQIMLYISTFINKGYYYELFGQTVSVLAMIMITEIYIYNKNVKILLKTLSGILFIYSIINIISIFAFEKTSNNDIIVSFLGMDNRYIFYLLPLCVFSILYSVIKNNKLNKFSYLVIGVSVFQVFYTWSVGAMITITILMIYTLLLDKIPKVQKVTLNIYLIIIIALNVLIVFLQVQYYFEDFIVNYLHKNMELSGRVYTWNAAIEVIKQHPIIGIGGQDSITMQSIYYGTNQHAHNLFLNILVKGGAISLLIQFFMYFIISKKLKKYKNKKVSSILTFSIFLILFLSLTDTFDICLVYVIYTIAYHINELDKKEES